MRPRASALLNGPVSPTCHLWEEEAWVNTELLLLLCFYNCVHSLCPVWARFPTETRLDGIWVTACDGKIKKKPQTNKLSRAQISQKSSDGFIMNTVTLRNSPLLSHLRIMMMLNNDLSSLLVFRTAFVSTTEVCVIISTVVTGYLEQLNFCR